MNCWPSRSDRDLLMSRATMSGVPPTKVGTITRTGRVGYVCAQTARGMTVSAPAPAASCKNLRRESFTGSLSSHPHTEFRYSGPMLLSDRDISDPILEMGREEGRAHRASP